MLQLHIVRTGAHIRQRREQILVLQRKENTAAIVRWSFALVAIFFGFEAVMYGLYKMYLKIKKS